ncbi:MAG TPA: VanW family protein [Abditibacteriaceae bacterium]|jgi:vancomycin resistance protein YoaR
MIESSVASPEYSSESLTPSAAPARLSPWKIAAVGGAVVCIAAMGVGYGAWSSWARGTSIARGVVVQGEDLSGLSKAEAQSRLEKRFGRLFVTVRTPDRDFGVSLGELGGKPRFDAVVHKAHKFGRSGNVVADVAGIWKARSVEQKLSLPIAWDKGTLRRKMWTIASQFNQKANDATLKVEGETVSVVPHREGRALNVGATCATLQKKYFAGTPSIEATVRQTKPRLLTQDLEGRDVKLGVYSTRYNAGEVGRTQNIHIAANQVDGMVLLPNEEFSFNRATGERTWKKGYRMAHIFETKPGKTEAEVVDGLAGGVCQVSSTLYNAVRRANDEAKGLKIVERNSHSLPVTYVPRGLDATVAWPIKDFRFRNSFPHPVYLRAKAGNSRLVISVWSRVKEG